MILQPAGWAHPKGYSNGMTAEGRLVFTAGQIGWNPQTCQFETDDFVAQAPRPQRSGPSDADLDGYVLGAFLFHSATDRRRKQLRIAGEADAHEYARSLHPAERLAALRSLAREAIEAA